MALALSLSSRLLYSRLIVRNVRPVLCRSVHLTSADNAKLGTAPVSHTTGFLPSMHWTVERILAISMLPLYPIALYMDTPLMNFIVVSSVTMHSYWGLDGVIKDYAFERRYGPMLMPVLRAIWKVFAGFGFAGLLYFNYNDIGFISGVKKLWAL